MSTIGKVINSAKSRFKSQQDPNLVSNTDAVGVECEIENVVYSFTKPQADRPDNRRFAADNPYELPDISEFWKVVKDGSLRNGTEFIMATPVSGANIKEALDNLQEFINVHKRNGEGPTFGDRTSVHVHLDARDMDTSSLTNFILVYMLVERVLFNFINPDRRKNNFCRPLTDSNYKYILSKLIEYNDTATIVDAVQHSTDKYSALNIKPIATYGSVEFRHHHGTSDLSKIYDWINIIFALKNASRVSASDWINIYSTDGYRALIDTVFKGTKLEGYEDYEDDWVIQRGVFDVREILCIKDLEKLTYNHTRAKTRAVNTLLYQYKKANNLLTEKKEEVKPIKIKVIEDRDLDKIFTFTN